MRAVFAVMHENEFGDGSIVFDDETETMRFYSFLQLRRSTKWCSGIPRVDQSLFARERSDREDRAEEKASGASGLLTGWKINRVECRIEPTRLRRIQRTAARVFGWNVVIESLRLNKFSWTYRHSPSFPGLLSKCVEGIPAFAIDIYSFLLLFLYYVRAFATMDTKLWCTKLWCAKLWRISSTYVCLIDRRERYFRKWHWTIMILKRIFACNC